MMKEKQTRKKRIIILIIIAAVIVAAGAAAFFLLTPATIEGDWELVVNPETAAATPDEAGSAGKVYYTFGKPGDYGDGVYKTFFDSGVEEGKYKLSEQDGKKMIYLGTQNLEYEISGSRWFGSAKMTIIYPAQTNEQTGQTTEAQKYEFAQAKAPDYDRESYAGYDTDQKLIGEWATRERTLAYYIDELSYTETVKFNDSGVMTIHYESADLALDRYMYYAYTAKDGKLTFSPVTDKDAENTVTYGFDKNGNLLFKDDKTASSIFSDAVFADVTYYPSDKLPKVETTTEATE